MSSKFEKIALVWKYFLVDPQDESIAICLKCPQKNAQGYEVGRIPRGGKTTNHGYGTSNQKAHLKNHHLPEYNELMEAEGLQKKKKEANKQEELKSKYVSVPDFYKIKEPLQKSSEKWKMITKDIAIMLFQDSLPYLIVEKVGFKALMYHYEKRYQIPSRKYFSQTVIPEIYQQTKETLIYLLQTFLVKASFTTDIWTSNSNDAYLSLTIHYISEHFERHNFLLEIANFPPPHTYDRILAVITNILQDFKIAKEQIYMILHDSASNMKKAFPQDSVSSINCSNHLMQLAMNDALNNKQDPNSEKNNTIYNLIEKLKKIVVHFHRSTTSWKKLKTTEAKLKIEKKKLVSYSETRWNGQFLMLERIDLLKQALNATLPETTCEIQNITALEWKFISNLVILLRPLHKFSLEWQKANASISEVIPAIVKIRNKLELFEIEPHDIETLEEISRFRVRLLKGLEQRFAQIWHNEEYLISTLLDPRFKGKYFDGETLLFAKSLILDVFIVLLDSKVIPDLFFENEKEHKLEKRVNNWNFFYNSYL